MEKRLLSKRIAFVTQVRDMGGSEIVMAAAIEAAYHEGAHVLCWCPRDAPIRTLTSHLGRERIQYVDSPFPIKNKPRVTGEVRSATSIRSKPWSIFPKGIRRLVGFVGEIKCWRRSFRKVFDTSPDLLIINIDDTEAAAYAGRWLGCTVLGCYHKNLISGKVFGHNLIYRMAERLVDIVGMWSCHLTLYVSKSERERWRRFCYFPKRKTQVIYNGVSESGVVSCSQKVRKELGLSNEDFVFCFPARLDPLKGHRILIEALARDRESFENARVLICGDGPIREELQFQCSNTKLDHIIKFLGWRDDLPDVFGASDCTIVPSLSEPFGLVAVESFMAQKPVIATAVGGLKEIVQNGVTGLLIPPASSKALQAAMLQIMANRCWAQQLGANGREDARKRFPRSRMLREYADVFARSTVSIFLIFCLDVVTTI